MKEGRAKEAAEVDMVFALRTDKASKQKMRVYACEFDGPFNPLIGYLWKDMEIKIGLRVDKVQ